MAETEDWIEARHEGLVTDAWWHAYLYALTKSKKFPKSPEEAFKKPAGPVPDVLVADAKRRLAAQNMDQRLKKLGRERVIRRKE